MDVTTIAAVASDMSLNRTQQAVQMAVLKKSLDVEAQGALQLIQAAAQVVSSNPPNLGQHVDTFA